VKNNGKNTTKTLLHSQTPNLNACVELPPKKTLPRRPLTKDATYAPRQAVLFNECGSAEAQVNAQVEKKCGLALARPAGVEDHKGKKKRS
jgi:hypothetical protein